MDLPPIVLSALAAVASLKYPLFFVGAIIEGPILFMIGGFLLRLGLVSLAPLFIAFMLGDLVGDVIWYGIGHWIAGPMMRRHGHFLSLTPERLERVKALFSKHHEKILLISKATLGFGTSVGTLVILLTAGVSRVSLRKFILLNAAGELILLSIMLTLGYVFGQFYHAFEGGLAWVSLGGAILVVAGLIWGFSRYLKNRQLV